MTLKIRIKRPLFQRSQPKFGARGFAYAMAGNGRAFLDTLTDCAGVEQIDALRNQQVQRLPRATPAPEVNPAPEAPPVIQTNKIPRGKTEAKTASSPISDVRPGAVSRAFSWLQKRYTLRPTRQLRVSETVSLGEKRFVAILHVEDRKFLIGGGASTVSLLTQLDAMTESAGSSEPLPRVRGVY